MTNLSSEQEAENSEEPEIVENVLDPDTVYKVIRTISKTYATFTIYPYNSGDQSFLRAGGKERRL